MLAASAMLQGRCSTLEAQGPPLRSFMPRSLAVTAYQDLSFGTVYRGIPASVAVHDPRRAGLFEVKGPANAAIRVEFVLPPWLAADAGARIPLAFGPGDGFADFSRGRPPRGISFDPQGPLIGSLGPNGSMWLRLGGTAYPSPVQPAGTYRATISITVYDVGS